MNISGTSNSFNIPVTSQASPVSQVPSTTDSDGDGDHDGAVHAGHHAGGAHGRGHMRDAMAQALQSLGIALPQSAAGVSGTSTTQSGSSASSDPVRTDLRQFMHSLFQAVKGESSGGSADNAAPSTDQKGNFSTKLSALISQVSSGSAPADLQASFSKLMSDLQPQTSTATDPAGAGAPTSGASAVTLQALLSKLQQNLGVGGNSTPGVGNIVNTTA
jgi:hypothetical protein